MSLNTVTVERPVRATASRVFAVLSDAGQHQAFDGSGALRGAPSQRLQLGSVFGMAMHQGLPYRTRNTVVEYGQDRLIAWRTDALGGLVGGRVWRYELEPIDDGTLVRETWDISRDKQRFFLRFGGLPEATRTNMGRSLENLAASLEA